MRLSGRTILITGGSSGIGLELGKVLAGRGNRIIACGRSKEKLDEAQASIRELITFRCDLSQIGECRRLAAWVTEEHPSCDLMINNAAAVYTGKFLGDQGDLEALEELTRTNFQAPVILTRLLAPVLARNPKAALVYVSTGLVYVPRAQYPFYCATKAALHSFLQTLRLQLGELQLQVVEVMMPAVDTPFHGGRPPKIAISVERAVARMVAGLEADREEIRVEGAKLLYALSRIAPAFAFQKINSLK